MKEKIIVFCAGYYFKIYFQMLSEQYHILALTDNDVGKWGKEFYGMKCVSPMEILSYNPDKVIIANQNHSVSNSIMEQIRRIDNDIPIVLIKDLVENKIVLENALYEPYYRDKLGNEIILDTNIFFNKMVVYFNGCNNRIEIKKNTKVESRLFISCMGNNNSISIGSDCFIGGLDIVSAEKGNVFIGNNCMMSYDIEIHQGTSHPIFDMNSKKRINYSKDIEISDNVWIGKRVGLMSGFKIGKGSVVGFGSVTSGIFGKNVIIAGAPARVIKENVEWRKDYVGLYTLDSILDSKE